MSQINVLGPVGFNSTGNYDSTKQYERLDVVYYEGSSYVAIQSSIGQLPTNATYWDKIAGKGDTGNGISSITKTSTSGLVDTYTITFTNGQTTTFEITNGANGSVVDVQVDGTSVVDNGVASIDGLTEMKQELEELYNMLPKVQGTGTTILLNETVAGKMLINLLGSNEQTVTGNNSIKITGKNLFDKSNAVVKSLNASDPAGSTNKYGSASNQKHVYIKCKPSTTYSIQKNNTINTVLGVFESVDEPAVGVTYKTLYLTTKSSTGKTTVTTGENAKYLDVRLCTNSTSAANLQTILDSIQIEESSSSTTYATYQGATYQINLGAIALANGDSIQKINDNWTIIRSDTTTELITDSTLINQLNTLKNARSYSEQTNITQENSSMPFVLNVEALKAFTE